MVIIARRKYYRTLISLILFPLIQEHLSKQNMLDTHALITYTMEILFSQLDSKNRKLIEFCLDSD